MAERKSRLKKQKSRRQKLQVLARGLAALANELAEELTEEEDQEEKQQEKLVKQQAIQAAAKKHRRK